MKQFSCGDVVPGCRRVFTGSEEQILAGVAAHAHADHGLATVPDNLVAQVRGAMVPVG